MGEKSNLNNILGNRSRAADLALVLLSLLLLTLPGALALIQKPQALSAWEQRPLAELPPWPHNQRQWRLLPARLGAWARDHAGLRDEMILAAGSIRFLLREPRQDVIFGRDGWLFLDHQEALAQSRRLHRLAPDDRATLAGNLDALEAAVAAVGARLIFVVAPNKETLFPERLPWWATIQAGPNSTDDFLAILRARGIAYLDLRDVLPQRDEGQDLYYPTDSHWTLRGAWLGARALVAALNHDWPSMRPLARDRLVEVSALERQEMRLLLGFPLDEQRRYTDLALAAPAAAIAAWLPRSLDRRVPQAPAVPAAVDSWDPTWIRTYRTPAVTDGPRILMLHDSFGWTLAPLLAESVPELVSALAASKPGGALLVRRFQPDLVVVELLERVLGRPARMNYAQPLAGGN
jgi:hypothetical protein